MDTQRNDFLDEWYTIYCIINKKYTLYIDLG